MEARGLRITQTALMRMGMAPNTAHALLKGTATTIKLKYLEQICILLNCTPNDVMVWDPPMQGKTLRYDLSTLRTPGTKAPRVAGTLARLKQKDYNEV